MYDAFHSISAPPTGAKGVLRGAADESVASNQRTSKNVWISMSTPVRVRKTAMGDAQAPEIRRLSSLLDVSQALSNTLNLKSALHHVLEMLARHHGAIRGIVTLLQDNGELRVAAS